MKRRERIRTGFERMTERKMLFLFPAVWLLALGVATYTGKDVLWSVGNPLASLVGVILVIAAAAMAVVGVCVIMSLIGTPFGAGRTEKELERANFTDEAGESPMLLSRRKGRKGVVLVFFSTQIPLAKYERHRDQLETVLNVKILSMENGRDMRHVVIKAIPAAADNRKTLLWRDECLSDEDFVLVLGEGYFGTEIVDISSTPHILIGGGTGSGKSVLLKLLLIQSIKKGAKIFLADFKGAVDYSHASWRRCCNIITDRDEFDSQLSQILDEMERRRNLLRESATSSIGEYNKKTGANLPRLIVACDEIAEVLDKTGLSKEEKEIVGRVERKLSTIAREGRAFGIHLVLSTQRPDAEILKGQIRDNCGYRCCGRANKMLMEIVLGHSERLEMLPPNSQGEFYSNMGTLFRAYYVEDDCLEGVGADGGEIERQG